MREAGYTSEEWKLVHESRKILHAPELRASRERASACRCTSATRWPRTCSSPDRCRRDDAAAILADAPGVVLVDGGNGAPTALEGAGIDPVLVGRLREDPSQDNTLDLWVTGDNLRKGAALNAVQLAELIAAS